MNAISAGSDKEAQPAHSPFYAADIRNGDLVSASLLKIDDQPCDRSVRVWRFSPFGIDIVWPDPGKLPARLEFRLKIGGTSIVARGIVAGRAGDNLISVRFLWNDDPAPAQWNGTERRRHQRYCCDPEYCPTAALSSPVAFNDFLYFRLTEFSRSGVCMSTSLRNKFLVPGMVLDLRVGVPFLGNCSIRVAIRHIRIADRHGKQVLAMGARFLEITDRSRDLFAEFLLQFGARITPEAAREISGMTRLRFERAIEFRFIRSEAEYQQVINLRATAYSAAGKISPEAALAFCSDVYDARSRIIVGAHHGKIVATARIVYSGPGEKLEHSENCELPGWLPGNDELVEVNRLCIDPEYQGGDLALRLVRLIALTVLQSGRQYILCSADPALSKIYRKIGLRDLGIQYPNKTLRNILHSLFVGHIPSALAGRGVGLLPWCLLWSGLAEFVENNRITEWRVQDRAKLQLYRVLKPAVMFFYSLAQSRRAGKTTQGR